MKKLITLLCLTQLIFSCSTIDEQILPSDKQTIQTHPNPHRITYEGAVATLFNFLEELDGDPQTRATRSKVISGREVITVPGQATRSGYTLPADTILYLVNFENESGFAVLSADTRIPDIIALTDEGNFKREYFPQMFAEPTRSVEEVEHETNFETVEQFKGFLGQMMMDYAVHCIIVDQVDQELNPDTRAGTDWSDFTYNNRKYSRYLMYSPRIWTQWHQWSPFNERTVLRTQPGIPAGCGPLAAAQIVIFHERIPGYSASQWKRIKGFRSWWYTNSLSDMSDTEIGQEISEIIYQFGVMAKATYSVTPSETSTYLSNLANIFKIYGFKDVKVWSKDVAGHTQQGCIEQNPVLMGGWDIYGAGHFWVVDAFMNARTIDNLSPLRTLDLAHCVFGWGTGDCDGWYSPAMYNCGTDQITWDAKFGEEYNRQAAGFGYRPSHVVHCLRYNR